MQFNEWEPLYEDILNDMGYDRSSDETSARVMKTLLCNSDLMDDDELRDMFRNEVVILGGSNADLSKIPKGVVTIATGSSIPLMMSAGLVPDIIVTDLDGDVEAQKKASASGSVTVMHAHGDNIDAIMEHAKGFKGKVIMTTQSRPDLTIYNFGGFTDGDRAVCMARHFGIRKISLIGFDFDNPVAKDGSDQAVKLKKLKWAQRIIDAENRKDIVFL